MTMSKGETGLLFLLLVFSQVALAQESINYETRIAPSITEITAQDKLKAQISSGFDNCLLRNDLC